jgi:hypothetical protein
MARSKNASSLNLYVKTFVISIAIFLVGLMIGLFIENFFVSDLSARAKSIENSVREIELEMLYFQELPDSESCKFLNEVVRETNNNLDTLARELTEYSEENVLFMGSEIKNIKTVYTSLLIKDWLLQEKIKKSCGTNTVSVLYFYSTEGCDDCVTQGNILTLLKGIFEEKLMVFPIDVEVELSMIDILRDRFNADSTPAIVINGSTYEEIIGKTELTNIICESLPEAEECK